MVSSKNNVITPKKEKLPPKGMEDITVLKARCKQCDKLYMVEKMINKGGKINFRDGSATDSYECFYYCNETCLDTGTNEYPHRKPKLEVAKN